MIFLYFDTLEICDAVSLGFPVKSLEIYITSIQWPADSKISQILSHQLPIEVIIFYP